MRGKKARPTKSTLKTLQKCLADNVILVCMVVEFLTSQVCNSFKKRNIDNKATRGLKRRVHSVL
ncbi:hypothetical protein J3Q64DRAFT_1764112 [Phycomyces blakesleeanus]|uniref:Homeodomain-like DNA binding domain-containing transcription factor n=1 Tax=Phycomyces blakesleeanus TaxID=4837 RepID=A0ABR3ASQ4_PHYBL